MKHITTLITILVISLLSSPSWSETVTMDELVQRNDLYYKQFTNVPFSGGVSGKDNGRIKGGKREGPWVSYHTNGQLMLTTKYEDGERDGLLFAYHDNGQLRLTTKYEDGEKDGPEVWYWANAQLRAKGNYKDGKKDGLWFNNYKSGKLKSQGNYKDGKKDGYWFVEYESGRYKYKGTCLNGKASSFSEYDDSDIKIYYFTDDSEGDTLLCQP